MYVLGETSRGYAPGPTDVVLGDGRVLGPFESAYAAEQFERWFGRKPECLASAKEIFEESVWGEELKIIRADEMSLETHPLVEVYDTWIGDDNGKVVFETAGGFSVLDPRRVMLVDSPVRQPARKELPRPESAPRSFNLVPGQKPEYQAASRHHGEMAVVIDPVDQSYLVCWRRDGRQTQEVAGISRHRFLSTAIRAADQRSVDYVPTTDQRKNRPRDEQRERLYLWEHSFASDFRRLADVSDARALAETICAGLGVRPPEVVQGRATLLSRSYYRLGKVVLSGNMIDNHTVVHEIAHHVVPFIDRDRDVAHGGKFAGVLLALMVEHMGVNFEEAMDKARERDVVVDMDVFRKTAALIERVRRPSEPTSRMGV